MASAGEIASQDRTADPAPAPAARTKQAIIVVGDADAQNISVVGKYRRLAGKSHRRIAAVGGHIHKGHAPSHSRSHWAKIEIYRPVGISADRYAGCVQAGHSNSEIAFEWLVEKCSPIVDRSVET